MTRLKQGLIAALDSGVTHADDYFIAIRSRRFVSGKAAIIVKPGWSATAFSMALGPNRPRLEALADLGTRTTLTGSYDESEGIGNDADVALVQEIVDLARSHFGADAERVAFFTGSAGTPGVLNWIKDHLDETACAYMSVPLTDLEDAYDQDRLVGAGLTHAGFHAAYGGSEASFRAAMPTHNPAEYPEAFEGVPILMPYSTDDPYIDPAWPQAFAAGAGPSCEAVSMGATGHDDPYPLADVLDFFDAHLS